MKSVWIFVMALLSGISLPAAPVELGAVKWGRDYEAGLKRVKESGRPMFLLFQEVPG